MPFWRSGSARSTRSRFPRGQRSRCARGGEGSPIAELARNSLCRTRLCAARKTSSIWCISAAISACRGGRLLGERGGFRTPGAVSHCPVGGGVLFGTVTARLAILGFAFKADTNDTREAPAIRICRDLRGRCSARHSWPQSGCTPDGPDLQQCCPPGRCTQWNRKLG